jgi:hypothetical protein
VLTMPLSFMQPYCYYLNASMPSLTVVIAAYG